MFTLLLHKLKVLISRNWLPKLICLLLAILVWTVIKHYFLDDTTPFEEATIRRSHP